MGFAAHNSGGQVRLGLSATVASAVLYSAVVLLGLGPASPSAQGREAGRDPSIVRVPRDPAVSGPARRLPQVSPGPARRHPKPRRPAPGEQTVAVSSKPVAQPGGGKGSPGSPRPDANPKTASAPASSTQPNASGSTDSGPSEPDPILTLPDPPTTVTVPVPGQPITVTVPQLPLPPVQLPPAPTVPLP